jgi:hypothetical protein
MAQGFALATDGRASSNIGAEISESASAKHAAPSDHLLKSGNCHVVGDRSSLDILARAEQHNAASLSSLHNPGRGFHTEARIPQGSVVKDGESTYLSFGPDNASETTTGRPTLKGAVQQIYRTDRTSAGAESLPGSMPTEQSGGESQAVHPTRAQYGGEVPSIPMMKPELPKTAEPPKESQDTKKPPLEGKAEAVAWAEWNEKMQTKLDMEIQNFWNPNRHSLSPYVHAQYRFDVDMNGKVSNITRVRPCGDAEYDKAVEAGIRNADIPPFPSETHLTGRTIPFEIGPNLKRHIPIQTERDSKLESESR